MLYNILVLYNIQVLDCAYVRFGTAAVQVILYCIDPSIPYHSNSNGVILLEFLIFDTVTCSCVRNRQTCTWLESGTVCFLLHEPKGLGLIFKYFVIKVL